MDQLLSNPRGLLIICCFGVLVLGLNLTLLGVLRGDKRFQREATRWTRALGAGREIRQQQADEAAELRRLVDQLQSKDKPPQDPPS